MRAEDKHPSETTGRPTSEGTASPLPGFLRPDQPCVASRLALSFVTEHSDSAGMDEKIHAGECDGSEACLSDHSHWKAGCSLEGAGSPVRGLCTHHVTVRRRFELQRGWDSRTLCGGSAEATQARQPHSTGAGCSPPGQPCNSPPEVVLRERLDLSHLSASRCSDVTTTSAKVSKLLYSLQFCESSKRLLLPKSSAGSC